MINKGSIIVLLIFCAGLLLAQEPEKQDTIKLKDGFGSPDQVDNALKQNREPKQSVFDLGFLQGYFDWKESLAKRTGFSYNIDYTGAYLWGSESLDNNDAGGGMVRFYSSWDLVNRGKSNSGAFIFKGSHRHKYGAISLQELGFELGYVGMELPPFNDDKFRLTNFYWRQRFLNDRISMVFGLLDATDYEDVYMLASPWNGFFNLAFSTGSQAMYLPNDAALGIAIGAYITDNLYAIANISDAGSMPTQPLETFKTFFTNNDYFKTIEIGWVSSKEKFYHDNIHLNFWHSDGSDVTASLPGWGFVYSATHYFGNKWLPFIRGGFAKDGGTLLQKSLNAGTSFQNSQGGSQLGVAFGWGQPNETTFSEGLRDQYTLEIYYRLQLSTRMEITPDLQFLVHPALNPDASSIFMWGIRGRLVL